MEHFCKLKELYRLIYDIEANVQLKHQLSVNECMALCAISQGKLTHGQIAEAITQSKSRMSKILTDLEQKGLIKRNYSNIDKRKITFNLTSTGRKKLDEVEKTDFNIPEIEIKCR